VIVTVTPNPSLDRTLTVPRISFDEMMRASGSRLDWGGKGFNVSRALQALGTGSVATGFLGGATGQMLAQGLRELSIAADLVPIAGETRTNTVIVETETGRYLKVNEPGPNVRPEELSAFLQQARARIKPGDLWILSGSLPPALPPDFYAQLVVLVQGGGARALLDASGEPLRLGCAAGPYLAKPNAIEAEELTCRPIGSEADALGAARFFLQQGVEVVALSLGAEGLLLASGQEAVRARPPRVRARNPVGAGDALLAGLAWAIEQGLSLAEMARWGVAAGTAAAMGEGVSAGGLAEVQALEEKIDIKSLRV
jgi:1-phosphofructokinase family hexose kinase